MSSLLIVLTIIAIVFAIVQYRRAEKLERLSSDIFLNWSNETSDHLKSMFKKDGEIMDLSNQLSLSEFEIRILKQKLSELVPDRLMIQWLAYKSDLNTTEPFVDWLLRNDSRKEATNV